MDNLKELPKPAKNTAPDAPQELTKRVLASQVLSELEGKFMADIEDYAVKYGTTKESLLELLTSTDGQWEKFLLIAKRTWDLKALETIEKARVAVHEKIERGSMEQAQKGSTAMAILHDKVFQPNQGPTFNIAGKRVEIKTSFNFKPYKK